MSVLCRLPRLPAPAFKGVKGVGIRQLLTCSLPSLQVLKPGFGDEVKVADVIGSGKGLVVFMRHIG